MAIATMKRCGNKVKQGFVYIKKDICARSSPDMPPPLPLQGILLGDLPEDPDDGGTLSQADSEPSGMDRCFGGNVRMNTTKRE